MRFLSPIILLACLCALIPIRSGADEYMSIREFHKLHPEQVTLARQFTARVRGKGQPISQGIQKRPVRIAFVYPGKQISDYWHRSILCFKKRMDEIGIRYELSEYFSKPAVDYRIQERQMKAALDQNPDYLVFTLDARTHRRLIERIITKGRPRLILQNITTPLRDWEGRQPFLYVGFDHFGGAEQLARYFLTRTRGKGLFAILYFSRGYVSETRGDTFVRYMKTHSDMILGASYYTDGKREKARNAALEIVRNIPVRFIYACATDVALGAADALRETGNTGKILVNGWGGGGCELEAVAREELDVTLMRMNDDNGVAMAEAIRSDIGGKGDAVPTVFSGDLVLVEKGIAQKKLDQLKARAFRYSGE